MRILIPLLLILWLVGLLMSQTLGGLLHLLLLAAVVLMIFRLVTRRRVSPQLVENLPGSPHVH